MKPTIAKRAAAAAFAALALVGTVGTLPASAKAGDVRVSGTCTGAARTKIKIGPRDGRLEVEAEVDSNRNGQRWNVRMRHNGVLVHNGTSTTAGRSGSFEVRKVLPNKAGTDTITAVSRYNGQTCTVTARI
jgi:hypothetical protein